MKWTDDEDYMKMVAHAAGLKQRAEVAEARIASLEAQLREREADIGGLRMRLAEMSRMLTQTGNETLIRLQSAESALAAASDARDELQRRLEEQDVALAAAREENERLQKESCLHMATADAMLSLQNPNIKDEIIDSFANQLMQNFRVVSFARMVCKEQKKITTLSADPITLAVFKLIDAIEYLDEQKEEYFRLPIDPKFREQLDMSLELQIAEGKLEKAESELAALRSRADDDIPCAGDCPLLDKHCAVCAYKEIVEARADDEGRVSHGTERLMKIMQLWGAIPGDWRHFFDDWENGTKEERAVLAAADGR